MRHPAGNAPSTTPCGAKRSPRSATPPTPWTTPPPATPSCARCATRGAARRRGSRSSSPRTCTTRGSCAEEYRRDAVIWRAGLDQDPVGSPERDLAERDVAAAEHLAAVAAARVEALERIQDVRTDWLDRTRELQERAAFAGDELERRGLDRDTAAPVGEQQELFTIGNGEPAAVCRRRCGCGRGQRRRRGYLGGADDAWSRSRAAPVRPRRGCTGGARGHGFQAGGHRAPEHRAPASVATRPPPAPVGAPSWPWTTRSMPPREPVPSGRQRHRAGRVRRAVRRDRTGRRTGTGAARPVRGANPRPLTSRPHSHCTSTALPATRRAPAQSTPPTSVRGRGHRRGRLADRLPGHPASRGHRRAACRTRRPSRRCGGRASPSRGRPGRRRPRPRGIPRRRRRAHRRRRRARACPPNSPADSTRRSTEPRTVGFGRR